MRTHIHTYIRTYTHTYAHTHIHTYTHIHAHSRTFTHIHTHTHIHMHALLTNTCGCLQGTFDKHTVMAENTRIFALNALVSSQQIYNIKEKISEDVLQVMRSSQLPAELLLV